MTDLERAIKAEKERDAALEEVQRYRVHIDGLTAELEEVRAKLKAAEDQLDDLSFRDIDIDDGA